MAHDRVPFDLKPLLTAEATSAQVFAALEPLGADEQGAAIEALGPELRHLLPGQHHAGHLSDAHKAIVKVMFEHTPDSEPETLARLLGVRFHLYLGPDKAHGDAPRQRWEARGLRRLWTVLEALPPADVEDNERLNRLVSYGVDPGEQAQGSYGHVTAAIGYDPATVDQPDTEFSEGGSRGQHSPDPLYGVNAFNETVRHEVGHAVDAQVGATRQHAGEPAWGGWRSFGQDVVAVARAMVESAGGPIHNWKDAGEREQLISWLARRLDRGDYEHLDQALQQELSFLDETTRTHIKKDPAVVAASICTVEGQQWMRPDVDGGVPVGGRVYQESYHDNWFSYDHAARARKVSLYQFRAPYEWFAEAYAAYYEPVGPDDKDRGRKLKERDQQIWAWIKQNIDGR